MPMGNPMSMELVALLVWLVGLPLVFAMLVVFYPTYLRRRIGRREANSTVVIKMPRADSGAGRERVASSRASQTPRA